MEQESTKRIEGLLRRLISHHLPPSDVSKTDTTKYVQHYLKVLSVRVKPQTLESTWNISEHIRKSLMESEPPEYEKANRLETLVHKVNNCVSVQNKSAVLQFLYSTRSKQFDLPQMSLRSSFVTKMLPRISVWEREVENTTAPMTTKSTNAKDKSKYSESPSDEELVRELISIFQGGISGKYITYSSMDEAYELSSHVLVMEGVRTQILQLCEVGWLFRKINKYVNNTMGLEFSGQIPQKFCYFLQGEQAEFYKLLAILENQQEAIKDPKSSNYLSIMKLSVWMEEPMNRLQILGLLVDMVGSSKGGELTSIINSYTMVGTPICQKYIKNILQETVEPILKMIEVWMIQGELKDPYQEFFVSIDREQILDNLWAQGYSLIPHMIPNFLNPDIAHKIFLTGKAVNFIKQCCGFENWILDYSISKFKGEGKIGFAGGDFLENQELFVEWVKEAYEGTNMELLKILFHKYNLRRHCEIITRYMLLGQGDFASYLMSLLERELCKPAHEIYKHNIIGLLETAIRGSNIQYYRQEFKSCMDVQLLEGTPGDNGWNIFSLQYNVPSPISTIITKPVVKEYRRVFTFLWKLKRVEHLLSGIWELHMQSKRQMESLPEIQGVVHMSNILTHKMQRFISNFLNYVMLEVLESSWKIFLNDLERAKDLDQVIEFHNKMVYTIIDKALLSLQYKEFNIQLRRIFDLITQFKHNQDVLYTTALDEFHARVLIQPEYNDEEEDYVENEERTSKISGDACNKVGEIYQQFEKTVIEFLKKLDSLIKDIEKKKGEESKLLLKNIEDLKDLATRLNFNEYYKLSQQNIQGTYGMALGNFPGLAPTNIGSKIIGPGGTGYNKAQQWVVNEIENLGEDHYNSYEKIGEGTFGIIHKGIDKLTGDLVALKRMKIKKMEEGLPKDLIREIQTLNLMDSIYVMRVENYFVKNGMIILVYKYMPTDLRAIISNLRYPLVESQIKSYMLMLFRGLKVVHKIGLVHRDIKPSNLLISEENILCIGDFGLARGFQEERARDSPMSLEVGTRWYKAPELLLGSRTYATPIDLWSAGCIFAELCSMSPLFPGFNDLDQIFQIAKILGPPKADVWPKLNEMPDFEKISFEGVISTELKKIMNFISEDAFDLLQGLLKYDPEQRLTATEALKHPFFTRGDHALPFHELPFFVREIQQNKLTENEGSFFDSLPRLRFCTYDK